MINGENATVYRLKANLKEAEYFLAKTVVRAPSDGYATQLLLKPGMFVRPLPLRPVMVFVPDQKTSVYAVFRQNSALRLVAGDQAEVVFNGLPGSVVQGTVKQILPAIANSSYQAQGHLQGLSLDPKLDGIYAEIELKNVADVQRLPAGTMGQVAVYSGYFEHVSIIRKILLRMTSWMHYLYIDH
jgi:multidrug resistance efflux pump